MQWFPSAAAQRGCEVVTRATLLAGALVFAVAVGVPAASLAQSSRFTLGSGSGGPGHSVGLPIYLTLPKDSEFERIIAIVEPTAALAYDRVEAMEENSVVLRAKESAPGTDGKRRVEITLEGGQGKPLQTGLAGMIYFTIDQDARPQMASLPVSEVKGFPKGSRVAENLRGDQGSVTVYEPGTEPVMTCFFFTH